jgi:hypothetical protein
VFVDVIPISALLYIISLIAIKMAPKKLEMELRKEEKVKKAISIEKKKEIVQKYESGVCVTDLANVATALGAVGCLQSSSSFPGRVQSSGSS